MTRAEQLKGFNKAVEARNEAADDLKVLDKLVKLGDGSVDLETTLSLMRSTLTNLHNATARLIEAVRPIIAERTET